MPPGGMWSRTMPRSLVRSAIGIACVAMHGTMVGLVRAQPVEVRSIPAPDGEIQELALLGSDLLVVRTPLAAVILRLRDGSERSILRSDSRLTDMDTSPDGSVLYVADWGGSRPAVRDVPRPHAVHRFDIATMRWQTQPVEENDGLIAYRIEAISGTRFAILGKDQSSTINVMDWDTPPRLRSAAVSVHEGDLVFDADRSRFWHINYLSSPGLNEIWVGNRVVAPISLILPPGPVERGGGITLATDARTLFTGRCRFELTYPIDLQRSGGARASDVLVFPEPILAATPSFAFGRNAVYDTSNAESVGNLGFVATAAIPNAEGTRLWAYNHEEHTIREFDLGRSPEFRPTGPAEDSPVRLLDRLLVALSAGEVRTFVDREYDASGAAEWAFGEQLRGMRPETRREVEAKFQNLLIERLSEPALLRMHRDGVLTGTSTETRAWEHGDVRLTYVLYDPASNDGHRGDLIVRPLPDGRIALADIALSGIGLRALVQRDQKSSRLSVADWALGNTPPGRDGRSDDATAATPPGPRDLGKPGATEPAEIATFFRSRKSDTAALASWFSMADAAEFAFGKAWTMLAEEDREYIGLVLEERLKHALDGMTLSDGEVVGASAQRSGKYTVIRYAVASPAGRRVSEHILLTSTPAGPRFVDATIGGESLIRPIREAFESAGVPLPRFAQHWMTAPEPPFTPDDSPLEPIATDDPLAVVSGFVRRIAAGRVETAFDDCFDVSEALRRSFGADAVAALSTGQLLRASAALSQILMPHGDAYEISELRRTEYGQPSMISKNDQAAIVAFSMADPSSGESREIRCVLCPHGPEWRIVDLQVADRDGEWRLVSAGLAERRARAGVGALADDLEAMAGFPRRGGSP